MLSSVVCEHVGEREKEMDEKKVKTERLCLKKLLSPTIS